MKKGFQYDRVRVRGEYFTLKLRTLYHRSIRIRVIWRTAAQVLDPAYSHQCLHRL